MEAQEIPIYFWLIGLTRMEFRGVISEDGIINYEI